jgi:hypothetical protein
MNTPAVIARNEVPTPTLPSKWGGGKRHAQTDLTKQSSLWLSRLNWIASAAPRNDGGGVIASPQGVAIQFKQARLYKTGLPRCARNDGGGFRG